MKSSSGGNVALRLAKIPHASLLYRFTNAHRHVLAAQGLKQHIYVYLCWRAEQCGLWQGSVSCKLIDCRKTRCLAVTGGEILVVGRFIPPHPTPENQECLYKVCTEVFSPSIFMIDLIFAVQSICSDPSNISSTMNVPHCIQSLDFKSVCPAFWCKIQPLQLCQE